MFGYILALILFVVLAIVQLRKIWTEDVLRDELDQANELLRIKNNEIERGRRRLVTYQRLYLDMLGYLEKQQIELAQKEQAEKEKKDDTLAP